MENEIKFYRMRSGEFVEKIRIDEKFSVKKNLIKFQKEKIEIKPYINTKDAVKIVSIVMGNYFNDKEKTREDVENRLISSTQIAYSYFLAVCQVMTNVETEQKNSVDYLIDSGFEDCLKENIKNYKEILESVYFAIEQKNNYDREKDLEFFIDETIYEMKHILEKENKNIDVNTKELYKSLNELKDLQEHGLPKEDKKKIKENIEQKVEEKQIKKSKKSVKV